MSVAQQPPAGFGLYIHWPFCLSKCPYCDFNSHAARTVDHERWRRALLREMRFYGERTAGRRLDSIFFGGGTPSLMEPATVAALIEAAATFWPFSETVEITLEANPGAAERKQFAALRDAGVNRLSLGVQALNARDLRFLGRRHSLDDALSAIERAQALFPRSSFDLIYARPEQTPQQWALELKQALAMNAGHLSLYQLTVEEGTPFAPRLARGDFSLPVDENAEALWDVTQELCAQAGLPAYEVSNHAAPGQESRHNLLYWQGGDYAGIGPGAHGRLTVDGQFLATHQISEPAQWLSQAEQAGHATETEEVLTPRQRAEELLMMGLRLHAGIDVDLFRRISGLAVADVIDARVLERLVKDGFIEQGQMLRLSARGKPLLNAVLGALIVE